MVYTVPDQPVVQPHYFVQTYPTDAFGIVSPPYFFPRFIYTVNTLVRIFEVICELIAVREILQYQFLLRFVHSDFCTPPQVVCIDVNFTKSTQGNYRGHKLYSSLQYLGDLC